MSTAAPQLLARSNEDGGRRSPTVFIAPRVSLNGRLDHVNTLRALAISRVFFVHCFTGAFAGSLELMRHASEAWPAYLRPAAVAGFTLLSQGHQLVNLFFVVAGFFIHRSYLKWRAQNPDVPLRRYVPTFLWRRGWRIVPPFWIVLLASHLLAFEHPFSWDALRKLAVNATLLKTLVPGYTFTINWAHWYVAVQWQLDLLYPVFLYLVARTSFHRTFILACVCGLLFTFVVPTLTSAVYFTFLPIRWWSDWGLGALLAHTHSRGKRVFPWPRVALMAVVLGFGAAAWFQSDLISWVSWRVGMALLLEWTVLSQAPIRRWERWLAPIGICSYSIYLIHVPMVGHWTRFLMRHGYDVQYPPLWILSSLVCFAFTVAVARLSYRYIEEPSVALGARLGSKLRLRFRPSFTFRPKVGAPTPRPLIA
jgi:peptidoglycan/LPS O-acetylase OafA/YrhL